MTDENEPRQPSRLWKWTRRVIVWLFLLQMILVVAVLIYAVYWNVRGPRELAAAIKRCRDQALLEDRRSVYERAAGENRLGPMYTVAFAAGPDMTRKSYKDLIFAADPAPAKPISPELARKLREFSAANRQYFRLLETALDAKARLPLIDLGSTLPNDQHWRMSSTSSAARHYRLLSLLAQADGKPAEAMAACERALAIGGILDGQSSVMVGLVRSGCVSAAAKGIEEALSRTEPDAADLARLRSALLEQADRIDVGEAARGELALIAEYAANPDLFQLRRAQIARMSIRMSERFQYSGTGPALVVPRRRLLVDTGTSLIRHGLCPGRTEAALARILDRARQGCGLVAGEPADVARWVTSAESRPRSTAMFPPRVALLMLRAKASLRVAAAALSVELYRRRNGRWPEKLSDVPSPVPSDPFTHEPMKYARTDDGCMVYSVGTDLTDDGGKSFDQEGDDIVFRLFDVGKRNRP